MGDKFGVNILAKQGSTRKGKSTGRNDGKRKPMRESKLDKFINIVGVFMVEQREFNKVIINRLDKLEENDEKNFDIIARNNLK
ncbi:MAG: hypothetical protein LBB45_04090 [Methanobrevibacter sp.]|nr:hypothetical protein [Candidatus Methanovirga basalitermitum]